MIKLSKLKNEIGNILQQDLQNLTELHMEVQAVFQKHLLGKGQIEEPTDDLQSIMYNLGLLTE